MDPKSIAMNQETLRLAEAMAIAARELHEPQTTADVLNRLVHVAQTTVPGADFAGVSIAGRSGVQTAASTDPVVELLDQAQYQLQEGPCLDAMSNGGAVTVKDLITDNRWPRFAPRAVELGIRSQMGIEIFHDQSNVGGLNLYASAPDAFDETTRHAATIFAVHAALALDKTMTISQLTTALQTRQLIGQAVGITMHRYHVNAQAAFRYLVRISQHSNTKLRDVAQQIIDDITTETATGRVPEHTRVDRQS
jgi:GAF domain-containing protein